MKISGKTNLQVINSFWLQEKYVHFFLLPTLFVLQSVAAQFSEGRANQNLGIVTFSCPIRHFL